jgi:dihydroorotate dehydrogenase
LSAYRLLRPLLFALEPETAHQLTLQLLRWGGYEPFSALLRWVYAAPQKPVRAFGLNFRNPVGLAAGYDKDAVAVRGLAALGFGHLEVGTVTPRPQAGNPKPRIFRLLEDEAVINRMGFPGRGAEYVQKRLNALYKEGLVERLTASLSRGPRGSTIVRVHGGVILGVNLGKNKETPNEEAVLDYLALLQNFAPLADFLTINISSPNTAGLRQLQGRAALEELLSQLHAQRIFEQKRLEKRVPLLVKLAPDLTDSELDEAVGAILAKHMDGIVVTNTTLERVGLRSKDRAETGGLSGRPLAGRADSVLERVVGLVAGRVPVIGVGGIMCPDDAKRKIDLGAKLVQVYTGLVYQGPGLVKQIVEEL